MANSVKKLIVSNRRYSEIQVHTSLIFAVMEFFFQKIKNEFETALVNEPSVFELLKFYCSS